MKKGLSFVLVICLVLAAVMIVPVSASAESKGSYNTATANDKTKLAEQAEYDDHELIKRDSTKRDLAPTGDYQYDNGTYMYNILSDNTVEIYAYHDNQSVKTLYIPSMINGHKVTRITYEAFKRCNGFESVIIPDTVTYIENRAFMSCENIKSVTIGKSVRTIEEYTFFGCINLTSITIPDSVQTIEKCVFMDCTGLTKVVIGKSVSQIKRSAFNGCTNLSSVSMGNSVNTIDVEAFFLCGNLKNISFPLSLRTIGEYAFAGSGLTSLAIPDLVNSLGVFAFLGCTGLKTVSIGKGITKLNQGVFMQCTSLYSVSLPNTLTYIDEFSLCICDSLKSVVIPKSVTYIGFHALGSTVEPATEYDIKVAGFTIYGTPNSAAQRYADSYGFRFVERFDAPTMSGVTKTVNGLKVAWKKVTGAAKYYVFRKTGSSSFTKVGVTTANSYLDKSVVSGKIYCYAVRCVSSDSAYYTSPLSGNSKYVTFVASPKVTAAEKLVNGLRLKWNKVGGAAKYRVSVKNGSSWKKLAVTTGNTYSCKTLKSGTKYVFSITALNANGLAVSAFDYSGVSATYIAAPALPTLKNTKSGVQVSWKKINGAAKYCVFRKTGNGKWGILAFTNKLSFVDQKAKNGVTYKYTIRCVSADKKYYTSAVYSAGRAIKCKR